MNYEKIYNNLIKTRFKQKEVRLAEKEKGKYFEKHHIIPKCKGGTNKYENIVVLTAREHFIAHKLLWLIYRDRQMALAFHKMISNNKNQKRVVSSRDYEEVRKAYVETNFGNSYGKGNKGNIRYDLRGKKKPKHSERMKGSNNPFYGKTHSKEIKELLRNQKLKEFKNFPKKGILTLNIDTGIFYESAKEAFETITTNFNLTSFQNKLRGLYSNKTSFIYCK